MNNRTKKTEEWIGELFTPTVGSIRPLAEDKREAYISKFKELGPFSFHQYDLDICKIYRQVDDLKARYKNFNGAPFVNYVSQIKDDVKFILNERKLDADFYAEHFYHVLHYDDPFFMSYLGLFLALSDALEIVPILEYYYGKFIEAENDNKSADIFLDKLEYTGCNFIRTNRFPEDYFIKHDKIMNWILSKREFKKYEQALELRMSSLIKAINKATGTRVQEEVVNRPVDQNSVKKSVILVQEEFRVILFNDLKDHFSKESKKALESLFEGNAQDYMTVIFIGNANQLVDVFRIYAEDNKISGSKRDIAKWICNHFMYLAKNKDLPESFDPEATENMIYGDRQPPKVQRIDLTSLKMARFSYYRRKKTV